jgi:hypothetical protein
MIAQVDPDLQDIFGPLFHLIESASAAALVRCCLFLLRALLIQGMTLFKVETLLYGVRFRRDVYPTRTDI